MEEIITELIAQLTLEEKVSLLAGKDMWTTVPVERVGIPQMKVSDGPNGARGADLGGDITSACFPVGIALGATWNPDLVHAVGKALAGEIRRKGAHVLLAPTVNIHRGVLNGRNFECYAEDPYLTAQLAKGYIEGVQSEGVSACVKHFVCNDSEFERNSISSEVGERALYEIYLPPFKTAVKEAHTWSIMSAYNKVNGTFASENPYLLRDILKKDWAFDGAVISDWWGSYSNNAAAGGLDLEMPGPARWLGPQLVQMVQDGEIEEAVIDDKVRRILRLMSRTGALNSPQLHAEQATEDKPETRALIRKAGAEAIVLLKNDKAILPLNKEEIQSIAVIGASAKWTPIMGGGSARVAAHYAISHLEGITATVGDGVDIKYTIGATNFRLMPMLDMDWTTGWTAEYFNNMDLEGDPAATKPQGISEIFMMNDMPANIEGQFSIRYTTTMTAQESGAYTFSLVSGGLSKILVDGNLIVDNWTEQTKSELYFGQGSTEIRGQVELTANQPVEVVVEYSSRNAGMRIVRIGCCPPVPDDAVQQAASLAAQCDVAVVFVGLSDEWESEGYDRPHMDLPGKQNELVTAVSKANPNTVVVLNTGSPVAMPWANEVSTILETWYAGQESGNALADVLFGDADPGGRLPQTFPVRLQDNPTYINYPGENGKVHYGEGIFVGYRYYEKKEIAPQFPFGHGLSYTKFELDNLQLNGTEFTEGDNIELSIDVKNIGKRAGSEVVQVYVRDVESRLVRPYKELKGFAKVHLAAGASETVTITLDEPALAYYDPAISDWIAESGVFELLVGTSSQNISLQAQFNWHPQEKPLQELDKSARLHVGLTIQEIFDDSVGKTILHEYFPQFINDPQFEMAKGMTLEELAEMVPNIFTHEKLIAVNRDLARNGN